MSKRVLVACEFSGVVREAFRKRGFDAWSCDLLPTEIDGQHIQGDVLEVLDQGWDLMIAHPPCTYIANSGVQHLHRDKSRWQKLDQAVYFFKTLLNSKIPKICIENPVPHKYAGLPVYQQIIQPYEHGHNVMKKTCLWLRGLPKLKPTHIVSQGEKYIGKDGKSNGSKWYQLPPTKDRWKHRSRTFQGIADAMAQQWGCDHFLQEPRMTKLNTPLTINWLTKPPHSKDSVFDIVDNGSKLIARGTIDEEVDLLNAQELIRRANLHDELSKSYSELIMAVGKKFKNETRHETALRYIKESEAGSRGETLAKQLTNEER